MQYLYGCVRYYLFNFTEVYVYCVFLLALDARLASRSVAGKSLVRTFVVNIDHTYPKF